MTKNNDRLFLITGGTGNTGKTTVQLLLERGHPYGGTITAQETSLRVPNIVRYAGGALEQNTGLTKFGQRYYNPALGAFTQQDTFVKLANPGNGNLYAYAGDSPIKEIRGNYSGRPRTA